MEKNLFEERKNMICELVNDDLYVPMKIKELAILLQVSKEERHELQEVLDALVEEGRLSLTKKGKYIKPDEPIKVGTFISNQRGFGFVETEDEEEDIFIPESEVNGAFHLDKVQVKCSTAAKNGKRREGTILKVIEHGITDVVGTFDAGKNYGFVIPDNGKIAEDIFIPKEKCKGAMAGHKVVVHINKYPSKGKNPEGEITEIIGHINDPGTDILSVVKSYDIPMEFPPEVMSSLDKIPEEVEEKDKNGRWDIRDWQTVTIDGEDAKDLDDAITISREGSHYKLGVHIADVTNYVQENSALDREAKERGTSVYLVDRVIPMLPHTLSNGMCSLNEGEDRLALSCLMDVDKKGNIVNYEIAESVIHVNRRMSYTQVKKILEEKDETLRKEYGELVPMFERMEELSAILRKKRQKRGAIDFDFPESKIILDKEGHPLDVKPYERNVANLLIEDFMLAANETVAQHFYWLESPFVYRIHENPDPDKMQKLNIFINNLGYYMKSVGKVHRKLSEDEVHPKEIQKLLASIAGTPNEAMISRLALRSMKQAKYSVINSGHFGLACEYYCHFTSPIRRYPDLQIHRIIKEHLRNRFTEERNNHYQEILEEVAKHSSETERRAEEAERETDKLKKMEYMEDRIGNVYKGVISGVTSWGIYVELPNTIEGMVHVTKLPGDYYIYDENLCEMIGEHSGRSFCLGQPVFIRVAGTDRLMKSVEFDLVEDWEDEQGDDEISRKQ